jgi:hypothetical protein
MCWDTETSHQRDNIRGHLAYRQDGRCGSNSPGQHPSQHQALSPWPALTSSSSSRLKQVGNTHCWTPRRVWPHRFRLFLRTLAASGTIVAAWGQTAARHISPRLGCCSCPCCTVAANTEHTCIARSLVAPRCRCRSRLVKLACSTATTPVELVLLILWQQSD